MMSLQNIQKERSFIARLKIVLSLIVVHINIVLIILSIIRA